MAGHADSGAEMTRAPTDSISPATDLSRRLGFWTAASTAVVGVVALLLAVTTSPRSGPYCRSGCIAYPYRDVAAFVPRDYLWMYPALLLAALFVVLVICVHEEAPRRAQVLSRAGVGFVLMGATAVIVDYAMQLMVVQPSLVKGETIGPGVLSQYNPHGVFIALESIGYLLIAVGFVFLGAVFPGPSRLMRALRWVFVVGGALTILLFVVFTLAYRSELEYRFEVFAILVDWLVFIVAGVLLAFYFRRSGRRGGHEGPAAG